MQDPGGESTEYSDDAFDEEDGIGLMRAAGPLAIVGLVLGFLATATLAASLFLRTFHLTLVGSAMAALAVIFMILTVVLFPIGLADFHEAGSSQGSGFTVEASDLTWGAGLVLGIIATVLAIGGGVLGVLARRDPSLT